MVLSSNALILPYQQMLYPASYVNSERLSATYRHRAATLRKWLVNVLSVLRDIAEFDED